MRKTIERKLGLSEIKVHSTGIWSYWHSDGISILYKSTDPQDMNNAIRRIIISQGNSSKLKPKDEQEEAAQTEKDKFVKQKEDLAALQKYDSETRELRELLELHINSEKIQDYFNRLNNQAEKEKWKDSDYESYEFKSKGMMFLFNNNVLNSIRLYAGYGEYSQYQGTLPFAIKFIDVRAFVRQLNKN